MRESKMFITIDNVEIENEMLDRNLFNITGSWKDNYLDIFYHLVKEDNGYGMVKEFDDGSFHMINVAYKNCDKYYIFSVPDSPADECFILSENILELRDSHGRIDIFKPISITGD
jgi:hypothetical protein